MKGSIHIPSRRHAMSHHAGAVKQKALICDVEPRPIFHVASRGAFGNLIEIPADVWIDEAVPRKMTRVNSALRNYQFGGFGDQDLSTGHYKTPSAWHRDHFVAIFWFHRETPTSTHKLCDTRVGNTGLNVNVYSSNALEVGLGFGASSYARSKAGWIPANQAVLLGIHYDDSNGELDLIRILENGTESTDNSNSGGTAISSSGRQFGIGGNQGTVSDWEGSIFECIMYNPFASPQKFFNFVRRKWQAQIEQFRNAISPY